MKFFNDEKIHKHFIKNMYGLLYVLYTGLIRQKIECNQMMRCSSCAIQTYICSRWQSKFSFYLCILKSDTYGDNQNNKYVLQQYLNTLPSKIFMDFHHVCLLLFSTEPLLALSDAHFVRDKQNIRIFTRNSKHYFLYPSSF